MRRLAGLKWIIPLDLFIQIFGIGLFRLSRLGYLLIEGEVGMTGTVRLNRYTGMILEVHLGGCIRTGRTIPATGLAGITRPGQAGRDRAWAKTAGRE